VPPHVATALLCFLVRILTSSLCVQAGGPRVPGPQQHRRLHRTAPGEGARADQPGKFVVPVAYAAPVIFTPCCVYFTQHEAIKRMRITPEALKKEIGEF
jgi:hypothetical protein